MDKIIGFLALFIMLTAVGIVLSKRSNTAGVLNATFSGLSKLQRGATAPITGHS